MSESGSDWTWADSLSGVECALSVITEEMCVSKDAGLLDSLGTWLDLTFWIEPLPWLLSFLFFSLLVSGATYSESYFNQKRTQIMQIIHTVCVFTHGNPLFCRTLILRWKDLPHLDLFVVYVALKEMWWCLVLSQQSTMPNNKPRNCEGHMCYRDHFLCLFVHSLYTYIYVF